MDKSKQKNTLNSKVDWPNADFSRVPYEIFFEQEFYDQEMKKIFLGPTWNYLAHSCEIPKEGDFVTNWIGDTNIIVNRTANGEIHAFKNSCSHRGTRVVDEIRGNSNRHVCPYHLWTFNLEGNLTHVPLEKGLKGKGGMPTCFRKEDHNLKKQSLRERFVLLICHRNVKLVSLVYLEN